MQNTNQFVQAPQRKARTLAIATALILLATDDTRAANERLIEEIIVTAQRVEENAQEVPMSLSAFTDSLIEDRQIVGILDVQLNAPNVSGTDDNFGNRQLSVRGISNLIEFLGRAQNPVTYHVNQAPLFDPPLTEFYDLDRIEVLRGPQGTLYGQTSVAGAINATTKRPSFEGTQGNLGLEIGNYNLIRIKGAAEATFSDAFAVRVAGLKLDRDGYIDNLANGVVPNVDDDLDGRDVYSFRITPAWRISDRTTLWFMYERVVEDDDRVRISNQVCKTNPLPTLACDPDAFALEPINPSAFIGFLSASNGLYPLGAYNEATGLQYDHPRPKLGIRDQHTDLEPIFEYESDLVIAELRHEFDSIDLSVLGSYRDSSYISIQDWFMDVGYTLNPTPFNPEGLWFTSEASTNVNDPLGGPCPILSGIGGVTGGCIFDADPTRSFVYDQRGQADEFWTAEIKLASKLGGPINWLIGGQYVDRDRKTSYAVLSNEIDSLATFGNPAAMFPQLYTGMDVQYFPGQIETSSAFGELYWEPNERVKLTMGLRYTHDRNRFSGIFTQASSFRPFGDTSNPPGWVRIAFLPWILNPANPDPFALGLTDYYGVTEAAQTAASAGDVDGLIAVLQTIPPVPTLGEFSGAFDAPDRLITDGVTGRAGIDRLVSNDVMIYAFYSRGRAPGGYKFATAIDSRERIDDEEVNAFELGAKSLLLDGTLLLNAAAFFNDVKGSATTARPAGALVDSDNVDSEAFGIELEARWRPTNNLDIDLTYGWIDTRVTNFRSLDIIDLTQGNPDLVLLRDFSPNGRNYVAPRAEVLAVTPRAIAVGAAIPAPNTLHPDGIPAWFARPFLDAVGVETSDGVLVDLSGNEMPTSPSHSLRVGIAYTWFWQVGALTARWDYYWQDQSYARVFNRDGDKIDSWDQHNASLAFVSADNRWTAKAWVRNIGDEDNVTDHYLHLNEGAGPYRNYFLTEPRVYGATFSYHFGER